MRRYPIGIQEFVRIRQENYLYIDKTKWIYELVTYGFGYFFARPRRFGKSLLISTLEALFLGKRELFKGLWIDHSDYVWQEHPVIRLDFSKTVSSSSEALLKSLQDLLLDVAESYGLDNIPREHPARILSNLTLALSKKAPVVILIDEYDKPLVHHLGDDNLITSNKNFLNEFFTHIKALSAYLCHVFITGVSKFSKVSLFSGLNNLEDISLSQQFATLTGITEREIRENLKDELSFIAQQKNCCFEELLSLLRYWYNGYRFSSVASTEKVYNPVSLLAFLKTGVIDNYWFATATPTFAVELLKKQSVAIPDLESGVIAGKEIEVSYEPDRLSVVTLLFQTGYLTITDYEENTHTYFLKFPNEEVKRSFLEHLLNSIMPQPTTNVHNFLFTLRKALLCEKLELFFEQFNLLLASIPYPIHEPKEKYYHSLLYLLLKVLGFQVEAEVITHRGRIDLVVKTEKVIYLFEFKIDSSAAKALEQIQNKGYFDRYKNEKNRCFLVGANFNTKLRRLEEWDVAEVGDHFN